MNIRVSKISFLIFIYKLFNVISLIDNLFMITIFFNIVKFQIDSFAFRTKTITTIQINIVTKNSSLFVCWDISSMRLMINAHIDVFFSSIFMFSNFRSSCLISLKKTFITFRILVSWKFKINVNTLIILRRFS